MSSELSWIIDIGPWGQLLGKEEALFGVLLKEKDGRFSRNQWLIGKRHRFMSPDGVMANATGVSLSWESN